MNPIDCEAKECIWNDDGECLIHYEGDPIIPGEECEYECDENE